jgi:hypothetical protein
MINDVIMREMGAKKRPGGGPPNPRRSPGNEAALALCSVTSKRESGHDISISDRAGSRHQGSAPATRDASGEMAARVSGRASGRSSAGDGRRPPDRRGNGLVASLPLGVLGRWKMAEVYCQAVLCHDQRIALDGAPAETVDAEARDLATKHLEQLAARKAAKKSAEAAAHAVVKPKHRDHAPAPAPPTKTPEQLRDRVRAALLRRRA